MSHPVPGRVYGENEYDPHGPFKKKSASHKSSALKAFGSEYNAKRNKRALKKGTKYALKHF